MVVFINCFGVVVFFSMYVVLKEEVWGVIFLMGINFFKDVFKNLCFGNVVCIGVEVLMLIWVVWFWGGKYGWCREVVEMGWILCFVKEMVCKLYGDVVVVDIVVMFFILIFFFNVLIVYKI